MSIFRAIFFFAAVSLAGGCGAGRDVLLGDLPFGDASSPPEASLPDGSAQPDGGPPSDVGSPSDGWLPEAGNEAGFCTSGERVPASWSAFLMDAVGFAQGVTGGSNGCVYHVDKLTDAGVGSLRDAAERPEPLWIVFDRSGDIDLVAPIVFGSNKTVDGRGQQITIRNFGFTVNARTSNIVVEHLTFVGNAMGSNNDAFQLADAAQFIWIDHCSMSNYGDGLVDITHGATDVTVSWSVFSMQKLAVLIGGSVDEPDDANIRVTLHHNWWNQTENYAPRLRFGRAHVYNNFIDQWRSAASAVTMRGEMYSEANIFNAGSDKQALATLAGSDTERGRAKSVDNLRLNGALIDENEPDLVFVPSTQYRYMADPADAALQRTIMDRAGAR